MGNNKPQFNNGRKTHYKLTPVKEIAVRNELPLSEVREAYKKCRSAVLKETINEIRHGKIHLNYFRIMDRIFSLTEDYLDTKRMKDIDEQEMLSNLNDFSAERGLSYSNVKSVYSKYNSKLSLTPKINGLEGVFNHNPELGKKAFDLTKRYFDIKSNTRLKFK